MVMLATAVNSIAAAEELYPFRGSIDLTAQNAQIIAGPQGRQLEVNVIKGEGQSFVLDFRFENFATPFFDMTAHLKGAVEFDNKILQSRKISGRIVQDLSDGSLNPDEGLVVAFHMADEVLHVDKASWAGLTGKGFVNLRQPFEVDFRFGFQDVQMSYALSWLSDGTKELDATGALSGFTQLAGPADKLSIRAHLVSHYGSIEKFSYDLLSLHLQGIYPVVELANSTVTKSSGFSFDLDGKINLESRADMETQFKTVKKIPLINENALQSQWVLKRGFEDGGKTETKFFLKKDKQTSFTDQDDSELFGMEKKIGF